MEPHEHPEIKAQLEELRKAYPGGDLEGHRRYHELIIEQIEAKKRLRQAVIEKTIPGIIWAVVVWVAIASWNSIKAGLIWAVR